MKTELLCAAEGQFLDSNRDPAAVVTLLAFPQANIMYSTEVADRKGSPLQMGGQKWLKRNRPRTNYSVMIGYSLEWRGCSLV